MAVKEVYSKDHQRMMFRADYRVTVNGRTQRIRKLFFSKTDAKNAIRDAKSAAARGDLRLKSKVTVGEWAEAVLEMVRSRLKPGTIQGYESTLKRFKELVGPDRRLDTLEREDLHRYVRLRRDAGIHFRTINRESAKLQASLGYACDLFASLKDWQAPKIQREPETWYGRERVLAPDEAARLLAALKERNIDLHDMVLFCLHTAARSGEIRRLRWQDVLWNVIGYTNGAVRLRVTKIRNVKETTRTVPMSRSVAEMLKRRQQNVTSEFVFPSPQIEGKARSDYRKTLKKACKKAGIIYGRDVGEGGFVFHDLRRTAVTWMRMSGVRLEDAAKIYGASVKVMLSIYSRTDMAGEQSAVDKLDQMTSLDSVDSVSAKVSTSQFIDHSSALYSTQEQGRKVEAK